MLDHREREVASVRGRAARDRGKALRRGARRNTWLALLACISVQLVCDLLQAVFRGALISPGYPLLVARNAEALRALGYIE
jgi:hypothetical protein